MQSNIKHIDDIRSKQVSSECPWGLSRNLKLIKLMDKRFYLLIMKKNKNIDFIQNYLDSTSKIKS